MTEDEERLQKLLRRAFVYTWKKPADGARQPEFSDRYAFYQFYEAMSRIGAAGFEVGAVVFMRIGGEIERPVRSIALTKLALSLSWNVRTPRPPRESSVAAVGGFMSRIAGALPRMILEWVEDMDSDDPANGLEPQPTEVIRGVLLSPSFDHARACNFWSLAAESGRFPCRIFHDRCRHDEGAVFSPYHLRAFGALLAVAPPEAVRHFGSHLRHAVLAARVEIRDDDGRLNSVPLTPDRAALLLGSIAGYIAAGERRKEVQKIFDERPARTVPAEGGSEPAAEPEQTGSSTAEFPLPHELHPL